MIRGCNAGKKCVVESDNGPEIATVVIPPHDLEIANNQHALKSYLAPCHRQDLELGPKGIKHVPGGVNAVPQSRPRNRPEMKPISVDFTLDGQKAIFYFTAEERVDFRALVRYLAGRLKTRIEMRQIGVRDEAKMLGGYGVCGRPLCCATFLTSLSPSLCAWPKSKACPQSLAHFWGLWAPQMLFGL